MDIDAMLNTGIAILKQNIEGFVMSADSDELTPELADKMMQMLRKAIPQATTAIYRTFLESLEEKRDLIVVNGNLLRYKCNVEKEFETFFGKMLLSRRGYQGKEDGAFYFPLDAAWGMLGQYASVEVREAMTFSCAHITPEETAQLLKKTSLFHPHATAIKHVVHAVGDVVAAHQEEIDTRVRAQEIPPGGCVVLAVSLDGVNVLLNEKGKKTGRPAERPGRAESGETKTAYKNAMVGAVSFYGTPEKEGKTPPRLSCHYTARMPEDHAVTFKARFEAELDAAESACPTNVTKMIILDGARSLWNYVDGNQRYADYIKVVDFFHATEHLSTIAELLFGKGTDAAKEWYATYRRILRDASGGVASLMRSIDYHAKKDGLSKSVRTRVTRERGYFLRNKKKMNYAQLRTRGLPIGSGPVEAACKTLVKTRLGRSGMRWSRKGGQRILDLRTYVKSNRWDSAWQEITALQRAA